MPPRPPANDATSGSAIFLISATAAEVVADTAPPARAAMSRRRRTTASISRGSAFSSASPPRGRPLRRETRTEESAMPEPTGLGSAALLPPTAACRQPRARSRAREPQRLRPWGSRHVAPKLRPCKTCQKNVEEQKGKEKRWVRFPSPMIQQRGVVAGNNIRIMIGEDPEWIDIPQRMILSFVCPHKELVL